jgi:hypothetical protein
LKYTHDARRTCPGPSRYSEFFILLVLSPKDGARTRRFLKKRSQLECEYGEGEFEYENEYKYEYRDAEYEYE